MAALCGSQGCPDRIGVRARCVSVNEQGGRRLEAGTKGVHLPTALERQPRPGEHVEEALVSVTGDVVRPLVVSGGVDHQHLEWLANSGERWGCRANSRSTKLREHSVQGSASKISK